MDLHLDYASPGHSSLGFSPTFECWSLQSSGSTPRRQLPPLPPLPREVKWCTRRRDSGSTSSSNPVGTNGTTSVPTDQNLAREPIVQNVIMVQAVLHKLSPQSRIRGLYFGDYYSFTWLKREMISLQKYLLCSF